MCDLVSRVADDPSLPESNRRQFLKVLGATAAAGGMLAAGVGTAQATPGSSGSSGKGRGGRTRLVLLGTGGGPTLIDGNRFGVSTAVAYGDRVYVVDLGLGSFLRLRQSSLAPLDGTASTFNRVRGIFFTHMHSDHLMDWPAVYATGTMNMTGRAGGPIEVRGPGRRDTLPRVFPPTRPTPPLVNPADPTPGIAGMSGYLDQAWAADFNDRARDSNFPGPTSLFNVRDIDLTGVWSVDPEGRPPRLTKPIPVWQDGDVTITATLVDHHPTAPAFGFRFDTPDGSVVISGDTGVSENLIDLAKDADYLVHEVIDPAFVERLVATLPADIAGPVRQHLLEAHTTIEQVGRDVAERAGAKNLVLTHLVPGNSKAATWKKAQRGYSGRLVVGEDLMEFRVG
ncbi:MBL fold metallo-hydrolase [Modestobacter lapidis]|nr:MBL fold metallo-hydrolase [Modestobacter lapidis]